MKNIKKVLIVFAIVLVSISVNAQSIKNFTLGDKIKNVNTTSQARIAGTVGTIYPYTLADGSIYKIEFIPGSKKRAKRSSYRDVMRLKNYIEDTYDIKLDEMSHEESSNTNFSYHLIADYDSAEDLPYLINFSISNPSLMSKIEHNIVMQEKPASQNTAESANTKQ